MSKAFIQKPAPAFSGTAVNKYGEFIDIKLSDYAGKRKRRIAQSDCFMSSWHIVVYLQGNMWSCSSIPLICKWDFYIYFFSLLYRYMMLRREPGVFYLSWYINCSKSELVMNYPHPFCFGAGFPLQRVIFNLEMRFLFCFCSMALKL